jgi:hypothetical protein
LRPQTFPPELVTAVLEGRNAYTIDNSAIMPPVMTNGVLISWADAYGPVEQTIPISDSLRQKVLNNQNAMLGTGTLDSDTSSPQSAPSGYYWLPSSWANASFAITNNWDDNAASLYDISSLGYVDTNGVIPAPVLYYAVGTISNLLSSTDLASWSAYTFNAWISTNGMVSVLYDGSGVPVMTNYGTGTPAGSTNTVPFAIWVGNEPKKFFRIALNQ